MEHCEVILRFAYWDCKFQGKQIQRETSHKILIPDFKFKYFFQKMRAVCERM